MRTQARIIIIEQRTDLLHKLYGEVHVGVEPSQLGIHPEDKEGAGLNVNVQRGHGNNATHHTAIPHYDTPYPLKSGEEDVKQLTKVKGPRNWWPHTSIEG